MSDDAAVCDRSDAAWYDGMRAALVNGSAPVLQDDGADVWNAVGGGHDDIVVYDANCRAYAYVPKGLADVADAGGAAAVAAIAALAKDVEADRCACPACSACADVLPPSRVAPILAALAAALAVGVLAGANTGRCGKRSSPPSPVFSPVICDEDVML